MLTLSSHSSNGSIYTMPQWLDAMLDFAVAGSALTLTVTNTTNMNPADYQFDLNSVYFNFGGGVTGLTLNGSYPDWNLTVDPDNVRVNGFGDFDVGLIDGVGNNASMINPGEASIFVLDITGTAPFTDADFTTHLSQQVDGHVISLAAAKFVNGGPTGDDSAFGAVIPEPITILLLGGGLLRGRMRRR
jgi:hypothetical protein